MSALSKSPSPSALSVDYDPFVGGGLVRVAPTTEPQREVWLADQFGVDASLAFNESVCLHLRGPLDVAALRAALDALVARRDALRAVFGPDGETLCIQPTWNATMQVLDLRDRPEPAAGAALAERQRAAVDTPFALRDGPLFRAELVVLADESHALLLTAHHIVCDGWSWWILVRELAALYRSGIDGAGHGLPPAAGFADYALAQAAADPSARRRSDEAWWLGQFTELPPPLELPLDRPRPTRRSFSSARADWSLDATLVAALRRTGARAGASLFATLLSAFASLLSRLSGQDDVVIAIPAAGQSVDGNDDVVGHCVHTLPLRFRLDGASRVAEVIAQGQGLLLDAIEHQRCTYGEVLKKLAIPRDPARPPLVSVMFNIDQALDREAAAFPGLVLDFQSNPRSHENFELFINAVQVEGALRLECQYNTGLFDAQSVRAWLAGFQTLLEGIIAAPEAPLARIDWLAADERAALGALQPAPSAYDRDCPMHGHFERQCQRTPDRIAVRAGDGVLTYAELDARANRIARALRQRGVRRGALVGLALERRLDMVAGWLGVLKSGAGYVPLDPGFPASRLAHMVSDAGLAALLTESAHAGQFDLRGRPVLVLDRMHEELATHRADPLAVDADAADAKSIAYVIYTSGSTGKPKGVSIPHRAVANFIHAMRAEPGMQTTDRLAAVTTLSFDIAVLELLLPLSVGAEVVLLDRDTAMDGVALQRTLAERQVNVMQATPATWRVLIEAGWNGSPDFTVLCGGEPLPPDLAKALLTRCGRLWNLYGPTETTIWSTAAQITAPAGQGVLDISIGRPIANTEVWILDRHGRPCPRAVPGELCIGGDGLALGYLHQPELTAERFVEVDFVGPRGRRLYRTGDRALWRRDGRLQHLGRIDFQVKIRGYRIELGEIETALLAQAEVANAVAIVREDRAGDARLVAYVVPRGAGIDERTLSERLAALLPSYMRPQHLVLLERLPSLPNGKLDRKALPAPGAAATAASTGEGRTQPQDPIETAVLKAMAEVLGHPGLGVDDDFFAAGGHSLLAAQLTARLNRELSTGLSLRALFDHPSAAALARHLRVHAAPPRPAILARADQTRAPLSVMQERMRLLDAFNPGQLGYNIPSAHRLRGPLDAAALERAMRRLAQRQTVLRTAIVDIDGEPVQRIEPEVEFGLDQIEDLSTLPADRREAALHERMHALIMQPFAALEKAPLVRTRLYRLGVDEHVLFFMAHHIIWDGWSFDLLYSELSELYAAEIEERSADLPSLPVSYGDFAQWQRDFCGGADYAGQLGWWRERMRRAGPDPGGVPKALPTDLPRGRHVADTGGALDVEVPAQLTEALAGAGRGLGVTLFNVLLGAYFICLSAYSGNRDLIVGTPVRGRDRAETEGLMGYFTKLLPIRVDVDAAAAFADFARVVQESVLAAHDHPDLLIDDIGDALRIDGQESGLGYHALFSFQDVHQRPGCWGNLQHGRIEVAQPGATGEIGLWFVAHREGLSGGMVYNAALFQGSTMQHLFAAFSRVLQVLAANPDCSVGQALAVARSALGATITASTPESVAVQDAPPRSAPGPTMPTVAADADLELLRGVWRDVLAQEWIGDDDNFFDLGGNSMQAALMAARVYRATGVQITLVRLAARTLAQIASDVSGGGHEKTSRPAADGSGRSTNAAATPAHQLAFLDLGDRRLLYALTPPPAKARGVVIMCAPLLHEHARSYRLFALLAQALAARELVVFRFDYHGCGDSSGLASEFSVSGACRDALSMFDHARSQYPGLDVAVLGISAGAFVADALARARECRLALWQPASDGHAWVEALIDADRRERRSTNRFPFLRRGHEVSVDVNDRMGFRLAPGLLDELRACRLDPERLESALLLDRRAAAGSRSAAAIELPDALTGWIGQIDIQEYFRIADVDVVAATLIESLGWGVR